MIHRRLHLRTFLRFLYFYENDRKSRTQTRRFVSPIKRYIGYCVFDIRYFCVSLRIEYLADSTNLSNILETTKRSFKLFPAILFYSRLWNNPSDNAAFKLKGRLRATMRNMRVCCSNHWHLVNYSNLLANPAIIVRLVVRYRCSS